MASSFFDSVAWDLAWAFMGLEEADPYDCTNYGLQDEVDELQAKAVEMCGKRVVDRAWEMRNERREMEADYYASC